MRSRVYGKGSVFLFCTCFIHFFVSTYMKLRSIFLKNSSSFGNAPEAKELSGSEMTSFLKP